MSSYLASFIIDPVYRQARRLSRLSATSDSSQSAFSSNHPNDSSTLQRDLSPPPSIKEDVDERDDPGSAESFPPFDSRARLPVPSPPPENIGHEDNLLSGNDSRILGSQGGEHSQQGGVSRRSTNRTDSDTSINPSHHATGNLWSSRGTIMSSSRHDSNASLRTDGEPRHSLHRARSVDNNLITSGVLPEDDGMASLRKKIHDIREQDISNTEKARLVHILMTEQWNTSQASLPSSLRPCSPTSFTSRERPFTPQSPTQSQDVEQRPTTPASTPAATNPENHYNVTPSDRAPTYAPTASSRQASANPSLNDASAQVPESAEDEEEPELGCRHYKRNVKLQCYTCKRWYTCRFCHDEAESHSLNRKKTENMLCMYCGCAQPAAQWCKECGENAAWYYCPTCKLWDNDSEKSIYHCNDCGICRVGEGIGKDFFHCKTCCACMSISIETTHRCIERATQSDCPICGEYMFTSPDTVVFMRCGHSIHNKCFYEYSKRNYKCPICSRSITNMETQFRNLDRTIRAQPMPPEFQDTKALVYCNDCSAKSSATYHWLGSKCEVCDSYNTAQLQLIHGNENISPSAGAIAAAVAAVTGATSAGTSSSALPHATVPVDEVMPASTVPSPGGGNPVQSAGHSSERVPTLSPYAHPQRAGRSVSSLVGNYFGTSPRVEATETPTSPSAILIDDDDADSVDFWGCESPRDRSHDAPADGDSDSEDEDDVDMFDDEDDDLEDDDDDDEDDRMEVFGHR